jgi:hypothetical protein
VALGVDIEQWGVEFTNGDDASYILLGDGTTFDISSITGLDLPGVRSNDAVLAGAHGSLPGQDRLESRTVDIEMSMYDDDELTMRSNLQALALATAPGDSEGILTFRIGDQPAMRLNARCRARSIPITLEQLHNTVDKINLRFYASDPLIYSEELSSGTATAPVVPAGRSFSGSYPWNFGAPGAGGVVNVNNAGTAPAPWTARIIGPCVNPSIIGPGGTLTWESSLAAGEYLDFDAHPSRQTIQVGGTSSQYGVLSDLSTWFLLPVGSSNVVLNTGDGNGSFVFSWRSAYLSAV